MLADLATAHYKTPPMSKKPKYLKMTISARAHNPPVRSQFKPNECIRCQAKQTVYKDGSKTVTSHILKRRVLVKLSQVDVTMVPNFMKGLKAKALHVPDGEREVFIRGYKVKRTIQAFNRGAVASSTVCHYIFIRCYKKYHFLVVPPYVPNLKHYTSTDNILTRYKKNSSYFDMDWDGCPNIFFLIWCGMDLDPILPGELE